MNIKEQLQPILVRAQPVLAFLRRYLVFGVFMIFGLIYAIMILRINHLAGLSPSDAQTTDQEQTIKRLKVDPETLTKIQQLQDQNIQVKSLFDQARQNPFAE